MTIDILVQSLNNKTVDLVKLDDMSKVQFPTNNLTTVTYDNYVLNIHTSVQSFTLDSFWRNLTNLQQDFILFALLAVAIVIIVLIVKFVKIQAR